MKSLSWRIVDYLRDNSEIKEDGLDIQVAALPPSITRCAHRSVCFAVLSDQSLRRKGVLEALCTTFLSLISMSATVFDFINISYSVGTAKSCGRKEDKATGGGQPLFSIHARLWNRHAVRHGSVSNRSNSATFTSARRLHFLFWLPRKSRIGSKVWRKTFIWAKRPSRTANCGTRRFCKPWKWLVLSKKSRCKSV